jgi:hypothetical protein
LNLLINQSTNLIGSLNINFTNGSTLKIDDTFTIRFSIRYDYNTASQGQSIYYNSYYGNLIVFPNRVITNNGTYQAYLNGALNTNTTYSYVDATICPSGRYIWGENYANTQAINGSNFATNPVFLTFENQASTTITFNLPFTATGTSVCTLSVYLELINNCNSTQTTISTSGSGFFDTVQKTF